MRKELLAMAMMGTAVVPGVMIADGMDPDTAQRHVVVEHRTPGPYEAWYQFEIETPLPSARRPVRLNPPTFRWREEEPRRPYTLEVAFDERFERMAERYEGIDASFYRPLEPMEPGHYHWRVIGSDGGVYEEASFAVPERALAWTPVAGSWESMMDRVPQDRPRIMVRSEDVGRIRELVDSGDSMGWGAIESRIEEEVDRPLPEFPDVEEGSLGSEYERRQRRWELIDYSEGLTLLLPNLCVAYLATGDERYASAAIERAIAAAELDPNGLTAHHVSDFANSRILYGLAFAYDYLHDQFDAEQRAIIREALLGRLRNAYEEYRGPQQEISSGYSLEQRVNRGHPWQFVMVRLTAGALALYHESEEAREWFEWSARAYVGLYPWFSEVDGGDAQQANYFEGTSIIPSLEIARLFDAAIGLDLASHPWYRNAPYFLMYGFGLGSNVSYFGNHGHTVVGRTPGIRAKGRTASLLWSHILQDPYITTFHDAVADRVGLQGQFLLLLHEPLERPAPRPLSELPKARLFEDVGVVFMRSDIENPDNEIFLEFRSSPYGPLNHSHPDQNTFNIAAFGEPLLIDSGHYNFYDSPHHAGWTKQTKAHNTILVNGEGQPSSNWDLHAWGRITEFIYDDEYVYTRGEAAAAYPHGKLERFDRHILWLKPDTFVVADDIAAEQANTYQWLLHAKQEMAIDGQRIDVQSGDAAARVTLIQPGDLKVSQVTGFDPPMTEEKPGRPMPDEDQWHLTAEAPDAVHDTRIIAVIQVARKDEIAQLPSFDVRVNTRGVTIRLEDGREGQINWR